MNEELTKPFAILELFKAIESMANGKAPKHDGIPIEFFKKCWHIVGEEFFDMITKALDRREFHPGMIKGLISFIPKEGDLKDLNH